MSFPPSFSSLQPLSWSLPMSSPSSLLLNSWPILLLYYMYILVYISINCGVCLMLLALYIIFIQINVYVHTFIYFRAEHLVGENESEGSFLDQFFPSQQPLGAPNSFSPLCITHYKIPISSYSSQLSAEPSTFLLPFQNMFITDIPISTLPCLFLPIS